MEAVRHRLFSSVAECATPRNRFIQVVKWYLSAFHAGRKSPVPKKPYNPILGETFQCLYDMHSTSSTSTVSERTLHFLSHADRPLPGECGQRWPCSVGIR